MATKQPYEVALVDVGCVLDSLVVVAGLAVLGSEELSTALVVNTSETLSEVASSGDSNGRRSNERVEGGIVAEIGVEGRMFGGRIHMVVERELGRWEVVDPVVLLCRDIRTEVPLERLVRLLRKAVGRDWG